MAMSMKIDEQSRFTDLSDEPINRLLAPIRGYEDQPILPLIESIQPISKFFNKIEDNVYAALHNCQSPVDGLNQQESASIQLYTMQFDGGPSLYFLLNQSLRAENREELKPWFSYLKLFLTALYKLPSQSKTVWCGVKNIDLSSKYKKGTKFAWRGVISCTTDIEVLESEEFLGRKGKRTIFSIECINGKSVENHSYFKNKNKEKEILLIPGSYFEVIGQSNPASQLHIIQLKEIQPPITLVKSPFTISSNNNPTSINQNTNKFSEIKTNSTSNIVSKEKSLKLNNKWEQHASIVAGGNGDGNQLNQFSYPQGIFIDDHQTIYIAEWGNHRIVQWESNAQEGRIVAGWNGYGIQTNQLHLPIDVLIDKENNSLIIADWGNRRVMRWSLQNNTTNGQIIIENIDCFGLAMDKDGSLYVSDSMKSEVRRWKRGEKEGTIVAGGNGKGDQLNQFNGATFIFVDENESLYVSDSGNNRVMKWTKDAKEGIIVVGGNGEGNSLKQLSRPYGVIVDQLGQIYVSDNSNHRVMCWCEGDVEGRIIVGGNGEGEQSNQLSAPVGLSFDVEGNLYVTDFGNHRIVKFEIDLN